MEYLLLTDIFELDHCGGVKDLKNYYKGKYYSHKDVLDILPVIDEYKVEIKENERFDIKSLSIIPFSLVHDVPNMGFLIKDNVSGYKMLYVTDTGAIDHLSFKDIDCFLCESNCDEDMLDYEDFKEVRLYDTHLSMQQTSDFLLNNANHNTKHCILCHISSSEEDYIKHQKYVSSKMSINNVEIIAINPHLKEPLEIVLKEDIGGFDFE